VIRNAAGVPTEILEWHLHPALRKRWPLISWWGSWCAAVLTVGAHGPSWSAPGPERLREPHFTEAA